MHKNSTVILWILPCYIFSLSIPNINSVFLILLNSMNLGNDFCCCPADGDFSFRCCWFCCSNGPPPPPPPPPPILYLPPPMAVVVAGDRIVYPIVSGSLVFVGGPQMIGAIPSLLFAIVEHAPVNCLISWSFTLPTLSCDACLERLSAGSSKVWNILD